MIEIVSHCWNYSRLLVYQLSSLWLQKPDVPILLTVFASPKDKNTILAVDSFRRAGVNARTWIQEEGLVKNRASGRNLAAKHTTADIVWFTDCDVLFGYGCLDSLYASDTWAGPESLRFPSHVMNTKTKVIGDEYVSRVKDFSPVSINEADFVRHRIKKATGAYQIVSGDVARKYGYVPHVKSHQQPWKGECFKRNYSDVGYRKSLGKLGIHKEKIDIATFYRIRQTTSGTVTPVTL